MLCAKKMSKLGRKREKTVPLTMIKDRRNDEKRDSVEDDLTERSVSYAYNNMEAQNRRKRRLETEEENEGSKKVAAHRRIDVASLLLS